MAVTIAALTALAVGVSFLAVYSGTSSRLRGQIDASLRTQQHEWQQFTKHRDISTPAHLTSVARGFIAAQLYHAESLVIVVQISGAPPVSNNSEIVRTEERVERSPHEHVGLLDAPAGFSNAVVPEAATMRLLSVPILGGGRRLGTLRVANPLTPVQEAQASMRRTFLVVGLIALLAAVGAGVGLASLIAAPLRRIASVATAVEAGDLSRRAETGAAGREVRVLSEAFDHMLDRLERIIRRQRDFVSDASHELRTPLSVIRAQVELLDRETDAEQRHEGTVTLLRRLDQLDRLVGEMLTLASAEAGQLVEPRAFDLGDFFEDLRRDLPLFGEREFALEPVDGELVADPERLTQVLRNLVRNAVAHTDPGGRVAIVASARGARLEILVTDTGPGIPPEQLEQIFERFHRLDRGRSRDRGGSGLGLAIARAIVDAHGGRIWAESEPGRGATFHVELPGYRPVPVRRQ